MWITDLDKALAQAKRTRRPILSLRLLGNFDEELTCANSRFFKRMLYPDPRVARLLREAFVLHWQSVRAVPIVTIDFGDGRRITKPLTGNSLHVVIDPSGRPVDALPGLFDPETFARLLLRAHAIACGKPRATLPPVIPTRPRRAIEASMLAPTKHMVEAPLLRAVMPLDVEADTRTNLELHARIQALFPTTWSADELVDWIYRELFLMPPDDPALGLDVPDPF
jgi:hypothetical protein